MSQHNLFLFTLLALSALVYNEINIWIYLSVRKKKNKISQVKSANKISISAIFLILEKQTSIECKKQIWNLQRVRFYNRDIDYVRLSVSTFYVPGVCHIEELTVLRSVSKRADTVYCTMNCLSLMLTIFILSLHGKSWCDLSFI